MNDPSGLPPQPPGTPAGGSPTLPAPAPPAGAAPAARGLGGNAALMLALLSGFCFFWRLGDRDWWRPDETRYAQVAREMMDSGHYIVPHLFREIYPDKPPLLFWIIAGLKHLGLGFNEWTTRLPIALCALVLTLTLAGWTARRWGSRAGLWAGIVFATSLGVIGDARFFAFDMLLTLGMTAALWGLRAAARPGAGWAPGLGAGVGIGFAILSKGPVGLLVPLAAWIVWTAVELLCKEGGRRVAWRGILPAIGVGLAIPGAWFAAAIVQEGKAYADLTLWKHTIERASQGWVHDRPVWYFAAVLPALFFPWILLFPGAAAAAWRTSRAGDAEEKSDIRFLLAWMATVFVFFSIPRSKNAMYILPMLPAAAAIVGRGLDRWTQPGAWDGWPRAATRGLGLVIGGGLCACGGALAWIAEVQVGEWTAGTRVIGAALGFGGILLLLNVPRRDRAATPGLALAGIPLLIVLAGVEDVIPRVNRFWSPRSFAAALEERVPPGAALAVSDMPDRDFIVYTSRTWIDLAEGDKATRAFLERPGTRILVCKQKRLTLPERTGGKVPPLPGRVIFRGNIANVEAAILRADNPPR